MKLTGGRRSAASAVVGVLGLVGLAACGGTDANSGTEGPHTPTTITVPGDAATIQAAVDEARTGDTVLVSPGTYHETVSISTPGITLQGTDRNTVVLDGSGLKGNGVVVLTHDVVVQNLTVQNYNQNGVLVTGLTEDGGLGNKSDGYAGLDPAQFPPVQSFAVRYVTASNNGLYGIYAFDSNDGVLEQNYASGGADSGLYVGQCQQCHIVVRDNVAELNAVGYEQANASDSVLVVHNRFTNNRVGLTVLSENQEAFVPMQKGTVVGNLVADNNALRTPHQADGGFGVGIGLSGALDTQVLRNRATGNETVGIGMTSAFQLPSSDNQVIGNTATGNGVDVAFSGSTQAPGQGNCLSQNTLDTTSPAGIAQAWTCPKGGPKGVGRAIVQRRDPAGIPFSNVAAPPAQPNMPASAATLGPGAPTVDLASFTVPPADLFASRVGVP